VSIVDASAGVRTESPGSTAEAAALLAGTDGRVLVRGSGTKIDWGGSPDAADLVLETSGLAGRVEHNPADLTVAVGAGTRLADLQAELAGAGQWLPYDPPSGADGATLGGLLATGETGPSRLRCGPLRDLVIGSTLVLADGTVAHSGGRVIKNVAGYDLTKVAAGSLGSLVLVSELVLRVLPRPAASCTLRARAGLAPASAAGLALFSSTVEPAALEWSSGPSGESSASAEADGDEGELLVRLDGGPRRVAEALDLVRRTLGPRDPGLVLLDADEVDGVWQQHRGRASATGCAASAVLQVLPDRLPGLVVAVRAVVERFGVRPVLACSLADGTLSVGWGDGPGAPVVEVARALRQAAGEHGATMLLRRRPAGLVVDGAVALGPPPSSAALLRRVKDALDPADRFAPGRFAPWFGGAGHDDGEVRR
jgi:glycolate oxidase FAD binding subunit